jgi:hypothetical protein
MARRSVFDPLEPTGEPRWYVVRNMHRAGRLVDFQDLLDLTREAYRSGSSDHGADDVASNDNVIPLPLLRRPVNSAQI